MKRRHFDHFAPICPVCLGHEGRPEVPLALVEVLREEEGDVLEGRLLCTSPACQIELPILEGIPFLVPQPAAFLAANAPGLLERRDLPPTLSGLLGDACGPGSAYDATRQHLSSYAWDHYGDLDPEPAGWTREASIADVLERALTLAGDPRAPSAVDLGCGPGRTSLLLAERDPDALVLGVDLHVPMLRLASEALRAGRVRYPRREVGLVYTARAFEAAFPGAERVDVWACDAARLPLRAGTVGLATALNLLDCATDPLGILRELERVLTPRARAALSAPYDWAPNATPVGSWLGGHSQRGPLEGDSAAVVRSLLGGEHPAACAGLSLIAEGEAAWRVRMHARAEMRYRAHLLAIERG